MMKCKFNHDDPDSFPEFLCRVCHPELIKTPEQRADEMKALKTVAQADAAERRRKDEILRTQARLNALEQRHKGDIGGVDAKVATGLRRKLARLTEKPDNTH